MESTTQSENNLNQNDIILTETQNPAPNIEDNKYSYSGYMNDQKTYEMYVIEKDREVLEIGNINLIEDNEGTRSEYIILTGLDKGKANIWLGEYDYNYFEKGEQDYSLR